MLSLYSFLRRMTLVQWSGVFYNSGTALLLLNGGLQGDWMQAVSAAFFITGGLINTFLNNYWLGSLCRLLGLAFLFTSLHWSVMTAATALPAMSACAIGSLEPFIKRPVRVTVFWLLTISRAPYLWAIWGFPWLIGGMLLWVAGDICQACSRRKAKDS